MKLSDLQSVVKEQRELLNTFELGTQREILGSLPVMKSHVLVVSGIRRCGKSVLLHQFIKDEIENVFYLNFADIRLFGFSTADFVLLDDLVRESGKKILFFDEIQIAENWELYIRQKLDQSIRIILTGSNARMLSVELGTHLTGRHISKELFPFSFAEYCSFYTIPPDKDSYLSYLIKGGFPEFLKTRNFEVLSFLVDDIIYKDIAARYGIRETTGLKKLCIYLISNSARPFSPSKLINIAGVKSAATVLEYISYMESCYLINIVSRFAWSLKGQMLSGKKVFVVDNGLINVASVSGSGDLGRKLENSVYWMIRRKTKKIWYFSDGHSECDFIYQMEDQYAAIQVCLEIDGDNLEREIEGMLAALRFFNLTEGILLTLDQTDKIVSEKYVIRVLPVHHFELENKI